MTITPYTDELARVMFVSTADQNYILARWAFFQEFDLDFLWLSLHAIEKYLKAVLLMNGHSSKNFGHDVVKLHAAVKKIYPGLEFGPLQRPEGLPDLPWRDQSVDAFLTQLNEMGSANNRYLSYGYNLTPDLVFKVDQIVWSIRRHCRRLKTIASGREIDWIEALKRNRNEWHLYGQFAVELVMEGKFGPAAREAFIRLNLPFAPNIEHVLADWRYSATNPPLAQWAMRVTTLEPSPRETAVNVLRWALDNIQLASEDQKAIRDVLGGLSA